MEQTAKQIILSMVPTTCPECGHPLKLSDDLMHLTCTNNACSGKLYRRIEIMCKAFGIENVGVKVAQELVECLDLKAEHEIFDLSVEDFLRVPRYQMGMAQRLYDSIHAVTEVQWPAFIRGAQFLRVGEGTAKDMAKEYKSLDEIFATTPKEMAHKMSGMTTNLTSQIVESINERRQEVEELSKRVTINFSTAVTVPTNTTGKQIMAVVTGPLGFGSRPEFQRTFGDQYGVKWVSAVSGNTDVLVTNETTPTGKYKKAKELQAQGGKIQIMTEEEFIKYIGGTTDTKNSLINATAQQAQELDMFADLGDTTL